MGLCDPMATKAIITKMRTRITDEILVDVFGRTEDGERFELTVVDTEPYFFTDDPPDENEYYNIEKIEQDGIDFKTKNSLYKITTTTPSDIRNISNDLNMHWEADIRYVDRVRYDNGWKGSVTIPKLNGRVFASEIVPIPPANIEPRICVCDIECWDKGPMATGKHPFQPIISISLWDSHKDIYMTITNGDITKEKTIEIFKETYGKDIRLVVKKVENEYQILEVFIAYLQQVKPDIVTGWYFYEFDWKYINGRCDKLNIEFDDSSYQIFDLLEGFKNLSVRARAAGKKHPKNLDFVGKELIGIGKVDHSKMWQMWESDVDRLAAYNLGDVFLTKEINNVKNILEHYLMVAEVSGCSLDDVFYSSKVVDSVMFHEIKGTGLRLPSKGMLVSKPIKKGATVFAASTGIKNYEGVVDNKAEYPSIIITLNMSPETKVGPSYDGPVFIAPSGVRYRQTPEGLIPKVLRKLLGTRRSIKAEMKAMIKLDPKNKESQEWKSKDNEQESFKYQINSFYGVLGSVDKETGRSKWRLADGDIGSDVTNIGREHVEWNAMQVEKLGHIRGYGDTDSSMFTLFPNLPPEDITYEMLENEINRVVDVLNGTFDQFALQYGCTSHHFEVEAKCIYEKFFQAGAKKRYAGLQMWNEGVDMREWKIEDRIEIVGFDIVRTNTPELQKDTQEKIITMALTGAPENDIRTYLFDIYTRAKDGEFDLQMGIPCGITKTEYKKTIPIHARAAFWSNRNIGTAFVAGDKPIYWYVTSVIDAKEATDVAALDWGQHPRDHGFLINYERMINRVLLSDATNQILEAIGMSWSEIISGMKDASLEEFF